MKNPHKKDKFPVLVEQYLKQFVPDQNVRVMHDVVKHNVVQFDALFKDLWNLSKEPAKYQLPWAMQHASHRLHDALTEVLEHHVRPKMQHLLASLLTQDLDRQSLQQCMRTLQDIGHKKETAFGRKVRYFRWLSRGLLSLDIIATIVLLGSVSVGMGWFDEILMTRRQSGLFLFFVLLGKVLLDKFILEPLLHRFGWYMYTRSLAYIKHILAQYEAISMIVQYDMIQHVPPRDIIQQFARSIASIQHDSWWRRLVG